MLDSARRQELQTLIRQGRLPEAGALCRNLSQAYTNDADALMTLGAILAQSGDLQAAAGCFERVLVLQPELPTAYYNLGKAYTMQDRFEEAMDCYRRALQFDPGLADAHTNLGDLFIKLGQPEQAEASLQQAARLQPQNADYQFNLATFYKEQLNLGKANQYYEQAIRLKPEYAAAHWNKSCVLLLSGNFPEGWQEHRWRFQNQYEIKRFQLPVFSQPRWQGESLEGKRILVYREQGIGDTLQFVRYLPLVKARGAYTIFACQQSLLDLLEDVSGIDNLQLFSEGLATEVDFDYHCPLLDLPDIFGTTLETIPAEIPYIGVDPQRKRYWQAKLAADNRVKVGLVWAGNPNHNNDRNRSCPLELFAPLMQVSDITFYSLQKGADGEQVNKLPPGMSLIDYTDELHDFADTAAFIEQLDLVISVDTSVAHLAGAMGKPVWTLLPYVPDWRWMLQREDSPWYPTMRLFRQTAKGEWGPVFQRLVDALVRLGV